MFVSQYIILKMALILYRIIFMVLVISKIILGEVTKQVKIEKFEFCDDKSVFQLESVTLEYDDNNGALLNAKATILRDLKSNIAVDITINRCADKDSPASCAFFTTIKWPSLCPMISMKGVAWESILSNAEPPVKCPLKKETYTITNATFDANVFNVFPMEGYYWKIKSVFFEGLKKISTFCFELSVFLKDS